MSRVIRIDDEVWGELQKRAEPFEDTPNDVLRQLLGLSLKQERSARVITSIRKGQAVDSRQELVSVLRDWLDTDEETLGDASTFGGQPWLHVEIDGRDRFVLNADTNRRGVERFIAFQLEGDGRWYVIKNRRGIANKVTNDPNREPIKGFFMYAESPGERTV